MAITNLNEMISVEKKERTNQQQSEALIKISVLFKQVKSLDRILFISLKTSSLLVNYARRRQRKYSWI
jgi:hypothetical protein